MARYRTSRMERKSRCSIFINMGDLVDNGEDHTQWNLWFEAVENIISAIPIAPVMGNHENI